MPKHPLGPSCLSRYGLPVNFQAVLLQPQKKSATKRLREVLNSVFRHLDEVAAASILDVGIMGTRVHSTIVGLFGCHTLSRGVWWWGNYTGESVVRTQESSLRNKTRVCRCSLHRPLWKSLDCSSVTRTISRTCTSTSTSASWTRWPACVTAAYLAHSQTTKSCRILTHEKLKDVS